MKQALNTAAAADAADAHAAVARRRGIKSVLILLTADG
jgi:hypothetical protein